DVRGRLPRFVFVTTGGCVGFQPHFLCEQRLLDEAERPLAVQAIDLLGRFAVGSFDPDHANRPDALDIEGVCSDYTRDAVELTWLNIGACLPCARTSLARRRRWRRLLTDEGSCDQKACGEPRYQGKRNVGSY